MRDLLRYSSGAFPLRNPADILYCKKRCDCTQGYSTGLFAVCLRWILVRDPKGEFKTRALLCTDLDTDPQKTVCWFVMRWQLEVTFQEMRTHLGFETRDNSRN